MSKTKNTADRKPAVARFGKMTKVKKATSVKGDPYVQVEVDCKTFTQKAVSFSPAIMERIIAAGEGARIFMRIVREEGKKSNGNGGTITVDSAKIVFFKDNTDKVSGAPVGAEDKASDETASDDVRTTEDEIPF